MLREAADRDSELDARLGCARVTSGPPQCGWLTNFCPTLIADTETGAARSAVDLYFMRMDGSAFRVALPYCPYFFLAVAEGHVKEVELALRRQYDAHIAAVDVVEKIDLDAKNHLSGLKTPLLKVSFLTVQALVHVRAQLQPIIAHNAATASTTSSAVAGSAASGDIEDLVGGSSGGTTTALNFIKEMREYDVPYHIRTVIDLDIRAALWYDVTFADGVPTLRQNEALATKRPKPRVLAYDIETTKQPLKFPDPATDAVMMISYMADRQGGLIVNRETVSADTDDFEYTPRPEFPGVFHVWNEPDEAATLRRFFENVRDFAPHVFVTFNGDFFDWAFVEARARVHGLDMYAEIGVRQNAKKEYYAARHASHIDCYAWVQRDSYLPHGSHGLKAVTRAKLGYDPLELDPEDMVRLAREQPRKMTSYSVSDAVATYYLYMQHIQPFIFSLCTIIPMGPDDVLRKGSGTLCENLLMVESYRAGVVFPNKALGSTTRFYKGHLLDSETYVGGHVESLESGVFRSDIPTHFRMECSAFDELIANLDNVLAFTLSGRKLTRDDIANYDDIRTQIATRLAELRDTGRQPDGTHCHRTECPTIIHLDVAAMYPNIILTNRLQPTAIVDDETCAACLYNRPENRCQRRMKWVWRGDYIPTNRSEYELIKAQIESESFPYNTNSGNSGGNNSGSSNTGTKMVPFLQLPIEVQNEKLKARLKEYSRRVHKRAHVVEEAVREDTVCMRENAFYVNTVRAFRDRRYIYKNLLKEWKGKLDAAVKAGADEETIEDAGKMCVMYDSMQLAHKCILNSFYGYVMRKGSRWMSMQMGGIVTHTGLNIITSARRLVQRVGRPLELDTDGIWCAMPASFPYSYKFVPKANPAKTIYFAYPAEMLNEMVAAHFSNPQYQTLVPPPEDHRYDITKECTIGFELDGPYKAMILPAGREKDQKLKKRYAVFNNNGTLAEMKGFELKRRGELKLIKAFQEEVFQQFLRGTTLVECYAAVADVANSWVDILDTHGAHVDDEELLDLLTESSNMSKRLEAYEGQRTAQVTTARRLAELLGDQVVQSEGLKCAYVVANKPYGAMVTERAVPTAVFLTDPATKRRLLSKWLKFNGTDDDFELRTILDWEYYLKRLGACIQKIVTIPAALQSVPNPVPRIKHPDWLEKQTREADARFKQASLETLFAQQQASKIGLGDVPEEKEEGKEGKEEKSGVSAAGAAVASSPAKKRRKKGEGRQSGIQGHLTSNVDEMVLPTAVPKRLDSFFVRQGHQLLSKPWHIVEVHETREPGEFRAWVFAENEDALRPITITVPRKFYVNFYKPPVALPAENGVDPTLFPSFDFSAAASSSSEGESATSTQQGSSNKGVKRGAGRKERQYANVVPPRSKVTHHMVEVRISEREYLARQQAYADLVCDTNVEGVYETNVPLLSRLLATVGCVFSVRPEARSRADYARFAMDELQFVNTTSVPYLGRTPPPLVFLYHSLCRRGPRATLALVALVFPAEQRAWVALVGSGSAAAASAVSKRLGERAPELRTGGGIAVVRTATLAEAYAAANDALAGYYSAGHRTHIVVTQTPLPEEGESGITSGSSTGETVATTLESAFPVLQSQMAHVRRPHDPRDGEYAAFDWEAEAAARLHAHYALCGEWFATQLALARYAHVPVGNVAEDAAVALPDVMFQRVLQDDRFVLWTSRGSRPDLGGSEDDDNQLGALEDRFPHVSCAGCYRDVCIDLDVRELALNAVAKAEAVAENDGGANMFVFASAVSRLMEEELGRTLAIVRSFDGTIDGSRPFREMRKLVQQWTADALAADALAADADADADPARSAVPRFFLLHLYRWLSSPHAALREPAITRVVTELMTRLFHQLLAELRRLGARVVYATFNRIVLSTGKYDVADALAYFHFLRRTVAAKPVFSSLVFEPRALYRVLLFLDIHNYGGVALPLAASSHSSSTSVDGAGGDGNNDDDDDGLSLSLAVESHAGGAEGDDDDSGETIISNWNIADFLPASMQSTFVLCVSAFIEHINEENKRHGAQLTARRDALAHGTGADAALLAAGDSTDIGLNPNVSMSAYVEGERDDDADADSDSWGASALSTDLTQQIFTFIQGLSSGSSPFLFFL